MNALEIKNLYPRWATPFDIWEAQDEGLRHVSGQKTWRVCPYERHVADCPSGQYWNELSCQCFHMASCRLGCQEGFELSPLAMCECANSAELK